VARKPKQTPAVLQRDNHFARGTLHVGLHVTLRSSVPRNFSHVLVNSR
jgi:hypothetical protein